MNGIDLTTEGFDLMARAEEKKDLPAIGKPMVGPAASFMSDPELFANYEDEALAKAEQALRDWIAEMSKVKSWAAPNTKRRRYTFSMLFKLVTGETYDQAKHAKWIRMWTSLFRYYSSRVQKAGNIDGKMYTKTIYNISPKRLKRPPYSLRLRIPWLIEHDVAIDARTMYCHERDELTPGHARNPRTEENMRRRSERGRRLYNERYKDRDH